MTYDTLPLSLRSKIEVDGAGCWIWTGCKTHDGYGQIRTVPHRGKLAHRVTYALHVGDVPAGLELDHLCRVRACCNPERVELVTKRTNFNRGLTPTANRTHCLNGGHVLAEVGTTKQARRNGATYERCNACYAASQRRSRAATKRRRAANRGG